MQLATTITACTLGALLMAATPSRENDATTGSTGTTTKPDREGWKLVWTDEFDKPGPIDPARWVPETGYVRNNEQQYYQPENARVADGVLVIEGRRERKPNPHYEDGSENWKRSRPFIEYTAASFKTEGKASWKYGRFEMRGQLPTGKGMWPAFWMLGDNIRKIGWPRCGEIDIMEYVGKEPHRIHGNVHWQGPDRKLSHHKPLTIKSDVSDFHIYAIEWSHDRIDFYFDDQRYHSFDVDRAGEGEDNPFRKPHFLLINLALGGSWGGPIDDAGFPKRYVIDYVRVYERVATPSEGE